MNMSFVPPITQFDQIQYANRTVEGARKGKEIEGVKPIEEAKLNIHEESEWERVMHSQLPKWASHQRPKKENRGYKQSEDSKEKEEEQEETKAKITGKGQHINISL